MSEAITVLVPARTRANKSQAFSKNDLPKDARIIPHGTTATNDHAPDRLNVSLNEDGTVANVHHG